MTTERDKPSSWREGGGNDGGGGLGGGGEGVRDGLSVFGLAVASSGTKDVAERVGSRRWIRLVKKPESRLFERIWKASARVRREDGEMN